MNDLGEYCRTENPHQILDFADGYEQIVGRRFGNVGESDKPNINNVVDIDIKKTKAISLFASGEVYEIKE